MSEKELEKKLKSKIGDYTLRKRGEVKKERYDSDDFKTAAERVRKILEEERSAVTP